MIAEELLDLPPWVTYQGVNFTFELINDGGKELRLVYGINTVDQESPHKASIDECGSWLNSLANEDNPPLQGFLVLYEGLTSDADLCWAARECWLWLSMKGLLT